MNCRGKIYSGFRCPVGLFGSKPGYLGELGTDFSAGAQ
jgi:hypothetical protein